jgi:hypothetical protein
MTVVGPEDGEKIQERRGRKGFAKGAEEDRKFFFWKFFCDFCETFAPSAFGCPHSAAVVHASAENFS